MDDVWNRRSAEQATRDAQHTKRMQQLNLERIEREMAETQKAEREREVQR